MDIDGRSRSEGGREERRRDSQPVAKVTLKRALVPRIAWDLREVGWPSVETAGDVSERAPRRE
jgi:hypothetical protein